MKRQISERNKLGHFVAGHKFWLGKKRPNIAGEHNHNWKGGKMIQNSYICVLCPTHPKAKSKKGYVYKHRLVMEKKLKRYLKPKEIVHHINGNKLDNSIKNLKLLNRGNHNKFHKKIKKEVKKNDA